MRSFPILALAFVLLGLESAMAKTEYQNIDPNAGKHSLISSLGFKLPNSMPDVTFASAVPSEPVDAPHDQGEATAEPPQTPAPASTGLNADAKSASIEELCNALLTSAEDNNLPVPFFANLIWQESRLQLDAVSKVGALGIAQFMPSVAVEVGLGNPFDPREAIPASARFLHSLRQQFGNLGFVAAAYNAGAHRVAEWLDHNRALPAETRTYVVRVTGRSAEAWRKSPIDDSELTFTRLLPCRKLPAFAELEQAQQAREAQQQLAQAEQEPQPQPPEANTAKDTAQVAATETAGKATAKIAAKIALKVAQKPEKRAQGGRHAIAERKEARRVTHSGSAAGKVARESHGRKHEATRHLHPPHERRKIA
jgi:hypothetical protein